MVTIGIPIHNRLSILKSMAQSLYNSNLNVPYRIMLYDDCSTDFDESILVDIFPDAFKLIKHSTNLKADLNMHFMYKDFLNYTDDYFFNADSDLLFSKNWLQLSLNLIKKTNGILSLLNTPTHGVVSIVSEELCVKNVLGAAGTLFARERIKEIINEYPAGIKMFDWSWSKLFQKNGVSLFCVNSSLVQHIGIDGQNARYGNFDYGEKFIVDSIYNGSVIDKTMSEYVKQMKKNVFDIINRYEKSKEYIIGCFVIKLIKFITFPLILIKRKIIK